MIRPISWQNISLKSRTCGRDVTQPVDRMCKSPHNLSLMWPVETLLFLPTISGKYPGKTVTVRQREAPDRKDKQGEGHLVMKWIAVATLPQAKAWLTFVWCLMATNFSEPINWGKQNLSVWMKENENSSCAPQHCMRFGCKETSLRLQICNRVHLHTNEP